MQHAYFNKIEQLAAGTKISLSEVIANLAFDKQGLIPVVTQDTSSKIVLMLAWMNQSALDMTLNTGRMTYWSRSRQALWIKGETSGHFQQLVSMSFDCDGDSILCQVKQQGVACHTGNSHCFYLNVDEEKKQVCIQRS